MGVYTDIGKLIVKIEEQKVQLKMCQEVKLPNKQLINLEQIDLKKLVKECNKAIKEQKIRVKNAIKKYSKTQREIAYYKKEISKLEQIKKNQPSQVRAYTKKNIGKVLNKILGE